MALDSSRDLLNDLLSRYRRLFCQLAFFLRLTRRLRVLASELFFIHSLGELFLFQLRVFRQSLLICRLCLRIDGAVLQTLNLVVRRELMGAACAPQSRFTGNLRAVCRLNTDVLMLVFVNLLVNHTGGKVGGALHGAQRSGTFQRLGFFFDLLFKPQPRFRLAGRGIG